MFVIVKSKIALYDLYMKKVMSSTIQFSIAFDKHLYFDERFIENIRSTFTNIHSIIVYENQYQITYVSYFIMK